MLTPPRLISAPYTWQALHALLHSCFAYMEPRINPPSSLHRLTPAKIAEHARTEAILVIEDADTPVACAFLTKQPDCLYIGKLAVAATHRGQGLARQLVAAATAFAITNNLPKLRLQTRIELTENHATFAALGFAKTAETAHPGFDRTTSITMEKPL